MVFEKHDRDRRARAAGVLVLLLLAGALVVPATSGCGNSAADFYLGQSNQILADINARAGDLKKLWSAPVAELGESQETLAAYRRSLAAAQEKLDRNDPPRECRRLDDLVRQAVDQGRELADITSPFADYGEYIAPIAVTMNEIASSLESIKTTSNQPAGLASIKDKCERLETEIRTIVPPGTFLGIHEELMAFAHMVSTTIGTAMGVSVPQAQTSPPPREDDEEDEETEADSEAARAQARAEQERRRSRQALTALNEIPNLWQSFAGKLAGLMEVAREVTGLKAKNYEVESAIGAALEEIKKLEGE